LPVQPQSAAPQSGVCSDATCSGHGRCHDGWCECDMGWAGATCAYFLEGDTDVDTPQEVKVPSSVGEAVSLVASSITGCSLDGCSGHGNCVQGLCRCVAGWTGATCAVEARCPDECNSPSGRCVAGRCICEEGFVGASCAERACANGCWGHGACVRGVCACSIGWQGEECDVRLTSQLDPPPHPHVPQAPKRQEKLEKAKVEKVAALQQRHGSRRSAGSSGGSTTGVDAPADTWPPPGRSLAGRKGVQSEGITPSVPGKTTLVQHQLTSAMDAAKRALAAVTAIQNGGIEVASPAVALPAVGVVRTAGAVAQQLQVRRRQGFPSADTGATTPECADHCDSAKGLAELSPGQCIDDCSGHGTCTAGVCQCSGGWSGETCDVQPCPHNCNQRGTCLMGTCACNAAFYGAACEHSRCLNDCSGNGHCNNGKCTCNPPFTGLGCQRVKRPEEVDPTVPRMLGPAKPAHIDSALDKYNEVAPPSCTKNCSGNGNCNFDGSCSCFGGYTGVACSDYCPNQCSGKGDCTDGACLCQSGFEGPDCSIQTCCSGHGDCTVPDKCTCNLGWEGDQCQTAKSCADPMCSSHGECRQGSCVCDPGWDGEVCNKPPIECPVCPSDGRCDRTSGLCMCGGVPCTGSAEDNLALQATENAPPPSPSTVALFRRTPMHRALGAVALHKSGRSWGSEQGREQNGTESSAPPGVYMPERPNCNNPKGKWDDTLNACVCNEPFHGDNCEIERCPGSDCSGRGRCSMGECICTFGWGLAPGSPGPNSCADPVCSPDCGAHGLCHEGQCMCQEGWQGPLCRQPKCAGDCSGHGICSFAASGVAECKCDNGFALPDCAQPALYAKMPACPNACSGNGLCFRGRCVCGENFQGPDCGEAKCPEGTSGPGCALTACPGDCSGRGLCFSGTCTCGEEHAGPDCSIPSKCFDACKDACLPDLRSERCEFCKGQCLTLATSSLGRHNYLLDGMSTLLDIGHSAAPALPPPAHDNHLKAMRHRPEALLLAQAKDALTQHITWGRPPAHHQVHKGRRHAELYELRLQ